MSPLLHDGEGAGDEEKSVVLTTSPHPAFGHLLLRRREEVILWIYFEFIMRFYNLPPALTTFLNNSYQFIRWQNGDSRIAKVF